MSYTVEPIEGHTQTALPRMPPTGIMAKVRLDCDRDCHCRYSTAGLSVIRLINLLARYNRFMNLVDDPGCEEQWRHSAAVVRAGEAMESVVEQAQRDIEPYLHDLVGAVDGFVGTFKLDMKHFENGSWACGYHV